MTKRIVSGKPAPLKPGAMSVVDVPHEDVEARIAAAVKACEDANAAALDEKLVTATVRPIVGMIRSLPSPAHAMTALGQIVRATLSGLVMTDRDATSAIGHLSRAAIDGIATSAQREAAKAARAAATAPRPEVVDAEPGTVDYDFVVNLIARARKEAKPITGRHNDRLVTVEGSDNIEDVMKRLSKGGPA